jgi:hypothetical protein
MKTLKKNEEIKGKIVTFKTFREQLLEELNKSFPDEYKEYAKIREEESKEQMNLLENQAKNEPIDEAIAETKKENE